MRERPQGSYGVDAPSVPMIWLGSAALAVVLAVLMAAWHAGLWTDVLCWYFSLCAAAYLGGALMYWHASLRGKFTVWNTLLGGIDGVHKALDLGCGRGAVAIMTALRFPQANVTGIDLWRTADQSGNGVAAATANARANSVSSRLTLATGDMTCLPFEDQSFDLVTAGLSIHNIPSRAGRAMALREATRVLAPGGHLIVVDIRRSAEYVKELSRLGLTVTGPERLGWGSWWTGPWMAASVVRATSRPTAGRARSAVE